MTNADRKANSKTNAGAEASGKGAGAAYSVCSCGKWRYDKLIAKDEAPKCLCGLAWPAKTRTPKTRSVGNAPVAPPSVLIETREQRASRLFKEMGELDGFTLKIGDAEKPISEITLVDNEPEVMVTAPLTAGNAFWEAKKHFNLQMLTVRDQEKKNDKAQAEVDQARAFLNQKEDTLAKCAEEEAAAVATANAHYTELQQAYQTWQGVPPLPAPDASMADASLEKEEAEERERKRAGAAQDDQPASKKNKKPDAEE